MELVFEQSEEYNKANELIKKASAYKNDDIKKAIELIQEAINIYPYEEYYFKLANYKYDAGLINDSYGILNILLTKYTYDSFINMKNANRSKIYEKLAILNFKEKNYKNYIKNSSMNLFNTVIALAIQGRKSELLEIINRKPFEENFIITKIHKAFIGINSIANENKYYSILNSFLKQNKTNYIELCRIYDSISKTDDFKFDESVGEYEDRMLSKNQEFNDIYSKLNESEFEQIVDGELNQLCGV
jgi:hypothetical protein